MPDIVYVDNEPDELMALADPQQRQRFREFQFGGGEMPPAAFEAAGQASLWLFDFFLVENVVEGQDENGLSLFQKWRAKVATGRPVTVLVSNDLELALGQPPGPIERFHVPAQRLGVEWLADKSQDSIRRIIELADASTRVAERLKAAEDAGGTEGVEPLDVERLCFDVLGVDRKAVWANSAQRQIDRARPPRIGSGLAGVGAARPILAWLLSHVLSYPSFLLSDAQAALRLGITPESFEDLAAGKEELLKPLLYQGPLASFHGRRWWRAAVDNFGWQLSQSEEGFGEALQAKASGIVLTRLTQSEPVLVSDSNLVETAEVAEASDCVRAADEDFPPGIDPAWIRITQAREDRELAAKVIFEDRELIEPAA